MLSFSNYKNADASVIKLLKYLSVNIKDEVIINELEKHPEYPSLLALSDVLTSLKIENSALNVTYDRVISIPGPFIAHTNINGGDFVVVNKIEKDNVYLSNHKWNKHKVSVAAFKGMFSGIVLMAKPSSAFTPPKGLIKTLRVIKIPLITASLLLVLSLVMYYHTTYFQTANWRVLLLTLFKSIGLITSILLLVQSMDSNNPLIQRLCKSGSKTNCNNILSSKAATVFEGLSWSEVGFFYFTGTWLMLLFGGSANAVWQALVLLNLLSLPYTIYSIYYQACVAKQWCILCCTVQALLWLEFIALIFTINKIHFSFDSAGAYSTVIVCMLLPVILWVLIKPFFLEQKQMQPLKEQLRKFKYNIGMLNTVLNEQPKYAQPDEEWSIVLGNREANNIITMITSPYCPPCSKTHMLLDELLKQNENVQARIVFISGNTEGDISTMVNRHLMALNELPDKAKLKQALHDWYQQKQKNYEAWAEAYPVGLIEGDFHKLDKHRNWCMVAEINATPTLLLNGHRLPNLYLLPDLKYMLE